jgi:hypothetical protein
MKIALVFLLASLTFAVHAADLVCSGRSEDGLVISTSIALRDGQPEGSLVLKVDGTAPAKMTKEESFLTRSTTFDIALTPYKYWIVELNDAQGLKRGLLVARLSQCDSSTESSCPKNSEIALDWNASAPYRLYCSAR